MARLFYIELPPGQFEDTFFDRSYLRPVVMYNTVTGQRKRQKTNYFRKNGTVKVFDLHLGGLSTLKALQV